MSLPSLATPRPVRISPTRPLRIGIADVVDLVLIVAASWLLTWVTWTAAAARPQIWDAVGLLALNGVLSEIGFVIALRRKYPILLTCFYFNFIFMAVAPIQQIGLNFDPLFSYEGELYTGVILCLVFTVLGLVALHACGWPSRRAARAHGFWRRSTFAPPYYPLVLWLVAALVTAADLGLVGPHLLSSRDELIAFLTETLTKPGSLVITTFLAPLAFIAAVLGLRGAWVKRQEPWIFAFIILVVLTSLISINASVLPRFRVAALMLFAVLVAAGWNSTRVTALFLAAGVTISPLLNAFREDIGFSSAARPFDSFFAHLDFDCFSLLVHVIHYVATNGYSYGSNILGGLLFFVPRALWPGKSEHIGYYIFSQIRYYRNVWTDNVSSPPLAEGYFALGVLGAVVFGAVVWAGFVLLERAARSAERDSPLQLMACLTPIYAIMILRGPFIVGFSELWGNYAALFAALVILQLLRLRLLPQPRPSTGRKNAPKNR